MDNAWFDRLLLHLEAEIDSEFRNGFPLWRCLPGSSTAKALAILTMPGSDIEGWKHAIKEMSGAIVTKVRSGFLGATAQTQPRYRWQDALAGHGAVWGKVSVVRYLDYESLRRLLNSAADPAGLRDKIPVSLEEFIRGRALKAPVWKTLAATIRENLCERLSYVDAGRSENLRFEKSLASSHCLLRIDVSRMRSPFGFDYSVSLVPNSGRPFQMSYERNICIGVDCWDRIAEDEVERAVDALIKVLTRTEMIINDCGGSSTK